MIGRFWTTKVVEARAEEYDSFACDVSLAMFRSQPAFRGAAMFRRGEDGVVLTPWQDAASVAALARSNSYAPTVESILAQGFLHGEQTLEIFDLHLLSDLAA